MGAVRLTCCSCMCSNQAYLESSKVSLDFDDLAFNPAEAFLLSDMMFICNACFAMNIFKYDPIDGEHYTTLLDLGEE
jgi:hypothetical protein